MPTIERCSTTRISPDAARSVRVAVTVDCRLARIDALQGPRADLILLQLRAAERRAGILADQDSDELVELVKRGDAIVVAQQVVPVRSTFHATSRVRLSRRPGPSAAPTLGSFGVPGQGPFGESCCVIGLPKGDRKLFLHHNYRIRFGDRPGETVAGIIASWNLIILDRVDRIVKGEWGPCKAIFRFRFAGGGGTTGRIDPATNRVASDNAIDPRMDPFVGSRA
jgi:hypothetical protein